jgi:hypothetical protein
MPATAPVQFLLKLDNQLNLTNQQARASLNLRRPLSQKL